MLISLLAYWHVGFRSQLLKGGGLSGVGSRKEVGVFQELAPERGVGLIGLLAYWRIGLSAYCDADDDDDDAGGGAWPVAAWCVCRQRVDQRTKMPT